MKEFKLTTMALLIGSLLMTNNVNAKIYDEDDGIITGSGATVAGGSYKIISVAGEDNTLFVENNGAITVTAPAGTPIVSGMGEFEDGDFSLASGAVFVANSGTINLGSGSTINQLVGDYIQVRLKDALTWRWTMIITRCSRLAFSMSADQAMPILRKRRDYC